MLTEVDGRVGHDRSRAVVLVEMFRLMREVMDYRVARRRERASWRLQIRPRRTMASCTYISIPSSMSRSAGTGTAFGDELRLRGQPVVGSRCSINFAISNHLIGYDQAV